MTQDEYAGSTIEGLKRVEARNEAQLWLYDTPDLEIALSTYVKDDGRGAVVNCVPTGTSTPEDLAKMSITKIREIFDGLGIEDFDIKTEDSYNDALMQGLVDHIDEVCWEVEDVKVKDSRRKFKMKRVSGRKSEDADFEGPKRKARKKKAAKKKAVKKKAVKKKGS